MFVFFSWRVSYTNILKGIDSQFRACPRFYVALSIPLYMNQSDARRDFVRVPRKSFSENNEFDVQH